MAYVDKFKIDDNSYDIKDTEGRTETSKKIDKDTVGNLDQTVSGNMNQTADGNLILNVGGALNIKQDDFTVFNANGSNIGIGTPARNIPVSISGTPQFKTLDPTNIDDNYSYVTMRTGLNNDSTKFLVSRTGKITSFVEPSPVSIEKYHTLKKD